MDKILEKNLILLLLKYSKEQKLVPGNLTF